MLPPVWQSLKPDPQLHLNPSLILGRDVRHLPEIGRYRVKRRRRKLRAVEKVQRVHAQLQPEALLDLKLPLHIPAPVVRPVLPQAINSSRKLARVERGWSTRRISLE